MVVKTFRGLLADGGQDRIRLSTIKGKMGYKIIKVQAMQSLPGVDTTESTMKIYKNSQTTIDAVVNFSDSDLLGVSLWHKFGNEYSPTDTVIFDNQIVNQDIYITHSNTDGSAACNYYVELEVIPLDDKGAEYTTVKDLRTRGF
jgi:hypothetical protein